MDEQQFTDLVRRHAPLIHKVAWAYCRDATDRQDAIQEIVLQLWRSRARYDRRFAETTWIYRVAVNVAISFHRREHRHRARRQPLDADAIVAAAPQIAPSDDVKLLLECIGDLPPLDRALVLLYLDGHDHAAMADVVGISVSNVGTKLQRIRQRLRAAFEERGRRSGTEGDRGAR